MIAKESYTVVFGFGYEVCIVAVVVVFPAYVDAAAAAANLNMGGGYYI